MSENVITQESKPPLNIYQKLIEVRKEVLYIEKNTNGYNFKYATTSGLLGAIRPKMDEMGLLLVPNMEEFELIKIRKGNGEVQVPMIKISYTWINADCPSEQIKTTGQFFEDKMTGSQGIGCLMTYAERYFLYKFFQVATDLDSPEEYYRKHELSANAEVMPIREEDSEVVEKATFRPDMEKSRLLAALVWKTIREKMPTLNENPIGELAYFLYNKQLQNPDEDISARFTRPCKDAEKFLSQVKEWASTKDAQYLMEQISHIEYSKEQEKLAS